MSFRGRILVLLATAAVAQFATLQPVRAQTRIAYEVTLENLSASMTRNLTRGTEFVDRDFAHLVVGGVRTRPRTENTSEPRSADGLFADGVLGDGRVHPGPIDPATGQPTFRLGPVAIGGVSSEQLMVAYSVTDLSHDTYDVSLKNFHRAVLATEGLIYSAASFADPLVTLIGAISTDLSEFAASLLGVDDPHSFNCDGVVLSDQLWVPGDQLEALTDNASHSAVLTDPAFLLPNSHSKGVTATDRGAGYMGLGDAPKHCGSRSQYELRVVVHRVDSPPVPLFQPGPSPCPGPLVPAGIVPAANWIGTWADPTKKVHADIRPVILLDWKTKREQHGFSIATDEQERTLIGRLQTVTSKTSGTLPAVGRVQDYGGDHICCSKVAVGPNDHSGDKPLGNTITSLLPSSDNVSLEAFKGCYESDPGDAAHLRYVRYNAFGTLVTDTMLVRRQAPVR